MTRTLVIIDLQMDYFPGGAFPLWHAEEVLDTTLATLARAQSQGIPVVLVQHVAQGSGLAPFFNAGTPGVEVHPRLRAAAPDAPVVVKGAADSFHATNLKEVLESLGTTELWLCGMMTQNCVTHTALSKAAEAYSVKVLGDACTTVTEILHLIALKGLSTRCPILSCAEAF